MRYFLPSTFQGSVCKITLGDDYSHGFYIGGGWVMTNSHCLDSVEEIEESVVTFSDSVERRIEKAFSHRLSQLTDLGEGFADLMIIKVDPVPQLEVLSSINAQIIPKNKKTYVITTENIYEAYWKHTLKGTYDIYELSSEDHECFQKGHSGTPCVFMFQHHACCVLFECRNGLGYGITWNSAWPLLKLCKNMM